MRLLLDSNVLIWWLEAAPEFSPEVKETLHDHRNDKFVSVASLWEMRIKQSVGKLKLPQNLRRVLDGQPLTLLRIEPDHTDEIATLPHHHKDPFDRMLIAQARQIGLTIATRDPVFERYNIPVLRV